MINHFDDRSLDHYLYILSKKIFKKKRFFIDHRLEVKKFIDHFDHDRSKYKKKIDHFAYDRPRSTLIDHLIDITYWQF